MDVSQLLEFKDALAKLIAKPDLFKAAAEAYEKDDSEAFREILTKVGIVEFLWVV